VGKIQSCPTTHSSRRRFAVRLNSGVENITAKATLKKNVLVTVIDDVLIEEFFFPCYECAGVRCNLIFKAILQLVSKNNTQRKL
jgi:hypothetical protein